MQAMLAAFLQTNTKNTGIQSVQADQIGRTYPPLFTLNLPEEEEIMGDLREITTMEYVVQVIMIIVCIAIILIIMYFCCTKCRHTCTIFKYCFPFLLISHIVRTSRRTDLFVEVTNITKGNGIRAHFISTGYFPTQIQLSRPIQKDDVQIELFVVYVMQLRSGEDPELWNILKNVSSRGGQAANCFNYSQTEGDGSVRAIWSSLG